MVWVEKVVLSTKSKKDVGSGGNDFALYLSMQVEEDMALIKR